MGVKLDQNEIMTLLDKLYDRSIKGLPMVSPPYRDVGERLLAKEQGRHRPGQDDPRRGRCDQRRLRSRRDTHHRRTRHKMFVKGELTASADTEEDIEIIEAL